MAQYEITYLSTGELAEDARAQLDAEVDATVRDLGGVVNFTSPHIPRRLFYAIAGQRTAGLRALHVELETNKLDELKTFLKKHAQLLRSTILNTPRRSEVPAAMLDQLRDNRGRLSALAPKKTAPKTPVTMEAVEKSIEKALAEDVK